MSDIKYPNITVRLVHEDGNAFSILGRCQLAMRKAGCSKAEIEAFIAEATSSDYDALLRTCLRYFEVC